MLSAKLHVRAEGEESGGRRVDTRVEQVHS